MKFSICIPNFNYERYLGGTVRSVLAQEGADFEIRVADNASTDGSVQLVREIGDPRISVTVNRWNVGFAGNLDRACAGASGERMMLLSSDDLMLPGALSCYAALVGALGERADRTVIVSAFEIIDETGKVTGEQGADMRFWAGAVKDEVLSAAAGCDVLTMPSKALLHDSLTLLRMPAHWLTMCYARSRYEAIEGYGAGRLTNPDKAFTWKLLSVVDEVIFVNRPLFQYRYHSENQAAQWTRAGALKHLVDQYVATFDTPPEVLRYANISREEMAEAFIEQDIALRGLQKLAQGGRAEAARGVDFGRGAYPALLRRNKKIWILRLLLALGPIGEFAAAKVYDRALARWSARESRAHGVAAS